ncbi:helix-turn-helix domain-containing protein [Bacteroides caecigallinarum]|uniref:helix-turn-helix domain-containing protein n=1 Tax=Bacteroides caecigallinarum TaxID=1411144 RepID=UPI00195D18C5|nr:AraC family transcriptional regulator [Bacteroides caecigallinarum]MBM6882747.1 AraC family transcriptional regulator [Bacteroides caecigallinarum]
MDNTIPKFDLPENWLAGTDISKELLGLYKNYPVRLKCEIMALCMEGEIEASVNLNHITVNKNDIITLMPGSIFQINDLNGDLKIYFVGFSSKYVENNDKAKILLDAIYSTLGKPKISLSDEGAMMTEKYFKLLIDIYEMSDEKLKLEIADNIFADTHKGISLIYKKKTDNENITSSKSEQLCKAFTQLVMQHYKDNRNVAWYAEKLGITHAHLCSIIKQSTGKTCADIISSMVIMDAKSQLKSTHQSVQAISDSLNFANMSFFGKYFKRHVGMSPLEYRNKG